MVYIGLYPGGIHKTYDQNGIEADTIAAVIPEGAVLVDRARFARLLAVVACADDGTRAWHGEGNGRVSIRADDIDAIRRAIRGLRDGDRDPLP